MPASATLQRHRVRWIALGVGVLLGALLVAFALHVYALLQPQRFTSLLEQQLAGAGIKLRMQAPAAPALFPRPAVRMQGFSLTNVGSDTPVLRASGATIVVPWRALLHGEVAIERVEITAPRIDLGQLKTLLARLPQHAGPPRLPTIAAGVHMVQGTLSNAGNPLLFELDVDTGELVPGHPFRMDASARSAGGRRLTASFTTVPSSPRDGAIDLNAIQLDFTKQGGVSTHLKGRGQWQGGEAITLHLEGDLRYPPLAADARSSAPATGGTPAAGTSTQPSENPATDHLTLDVRPPRGQSPLSIALQLSGDDTNANVRLQPTEFGAWWRRLLAASPGHPPGPLPFTGTASVRNLDLGQLRITGLHIEADPDLAPASATTAAPPAAASTAR